MKTLRFAPVFVLLLWPAIGGAQDCKVRFAVAYLDGKTLQVGLTADQVKFWHHNGATHYAGLCLEDQKPDHLIIWMRGTPDEGVAQAAVNAFQRAHGVAATSETRSATTQHGSPVPARTQGYYWLFDLSKNPPEIIDGGEPVMFRHGDPGGTSIDPRGHDLTPNTVAVIDVIQAVKLPLDKLKKIKK